MRDAFPETRLSLIEAVRSADEAERRRALDVLAAAYWRPVYKYVRVAWRKDEPSAEDLTQELFTKLVEKEWLDRFDPRKARLRTFLRVLVDGLAANEEKAGRRLKRGGGAAELSLDAVEAEAELVRFPAPANESPEACFEREWRRRLFTRAVRELKDECHARGRDVTFELFAAYDLEDGEGRPSYADLAARFGVKPTDVTNQLAAARRDFRRLVLSLVAKETASDEELRREKRELLGG